MISMFRYATSFDQPKTLRRCVRPCMRTRAYAIMRTRAYANEQPHAHGSLGTARAASLTPVGPSALLSPSNGCTHVQAELEPLQKRSVAELKELCALNGLHKKGVKADLVARLLDALCVLRGS